MKIRWNEVLGGAIYLLIASVIMGVLFMFFIQNPELKRFIVGLAAFITAAIVFYANFRFPQKITRRDSLSSAINFWFFLSIVAYAVFATSTANRILPSDAIFLVVVFGISLVVIPLAGEIGRRLAPRKSAPVTREEGEPLRGWFYHAFQIITIILLSAIILYSGHREQTSPQRGATKSMLRNLATAQESYHADHGTYAKNPADLKKYGWIAEDDISVHIIASGTTSWSATASHKSTGVVFTYSSGEGGLQ